MYILLTQAQTWILCIGIILGVILILGVVLFLLFGLRKKRENPQIKIDLEFINALLLGLGGKENIKELANDNGRVKFLVSDLDLLNTEKLKELAKSGVFISGNNVKLLFKYEALEVIQMLKEAGIE